MSGEKKLYTINVTVTCMASFTVWATDEADVQRQYVDNVDGIYDEVTIALEDDLRMRNDQFVEVTEGED